MEGLIKIKDKSMCVIKRVARYVPQNDFFEAITFSLKETEKVVEGMS